MVMTLMSIQDEKTGGERAGRPRATPGLAALALFVAAVNLRPAIAAVSPLVDTIRSDLGLTVVEVGLLTTLPTLAMGVCAPLAAMVGRRLGLQRGVLLGLVIIAIATAARAGGESTWLQMSCATLAGVGIAIAQTLLPAVVRSRFSSRAQLVTGIYTAGLGLGAVVAVAVSVPLANLFESWPAALSSWAALALIAIALWIRGSDALDLSEATSPAGPQRHSLPWRDPLAWQITAASAINSALYYCELAWIAPLLHSDAHRSTAAAGELLTVMLVIQVASMLLTPLALGERTDRRVGLNLTALMLAGGLLGLALSPARDTWIWLVLIGVGHGGFFPLVLALPATMSRDSQHASQLSSMAFFIGYGSAAAAPLLVAWLRSTQGNYHAAFTILAIAAAATLIPCARLTTRTPAR